MSKIITSEMRRKLFESKISAKPASKTVKSESNAARRLQLRKAMMERLAKARKTAKTESNADRRRRYEQVKRAIRARKDHC